MGFPTRSITQRAARAVVASLTSRVPRLPTVVSVRATVRRAGTVLVAATSLAPADAVAQGAPQWGALEAGPYAVGFRVIRTSDRTRSYWPPVSFDGTRDTLATARPMLISVWYPVERGIEAGRMVFGDYVALQGEALGLDRTTPDDRRDAIESLRRGPLDPYFPDGVSDEDLRRVLATPTASMRDADPARGPFPLLIHAGFTIGQTVLLEYLTSHGYVVAATPLLGTSAAWYNRGEGTPLAHQAGADDIAFVHGTLGMLPYADPGRAAVIGMFSAEGLLYQMQHLRLRALAVLDGGYPASLREVPGFDLNAVRIPVLDMPRSGDRPDRAMLDSMRYATQYRVRFDSVNHADFYQFRRIAHPHRAAEHVSYRIIARYTLAFLDHALKEQPAAESLLASGPQRFGAPGGLARLERRAALPAAPTAGEFLLLIRNGAFARARAAWIAYEATEPHRPLVAESPLTTTLLFLRRDHGAATAVEGFRLLVEMYPGSWRASEHLATTYHQARDAVHARRAYRDALRLLRAAPITAAERVPHESRINARLRELDG